MRSLCFQVFRYLQKEISASVVYSRSIFNMHPLGVSCQHIIVRLKILFESFIISLIITWLLWE